MSRAALCIARIALVAAAGPVKGLVAQQDSLVHARNDSVRIRLNGVDLRSAVQSLARYLDRPVIVGSIGDFRVTLETPEPVPRTKLAELLRGLLAAHGLSLNQDSAFYLVGSQQTQPALESSVGEASPLLLFVLPLQHAKASDVAATVNALYGRASAVGEIGPPKPTLADALRQDLVPSVDSAVPVRQRPVTPLVAELSGDVTIIPDSRTNNLLIRASRRDFDLIAAAVRQIDIRPLQVLIEVVIAEVRRDRSLSFGVEAEFARDNVAGSTKGLGVGDLILRVMKVGASDVTATLAAAASRGDATILSRPAILATNNEVAEILVGSQRPFVQVQRALPTDTPSRDQVVQFRDVGTRLRVQPTISEDGYIALQVVQEVSAATAEVAFDAPVISTRSIQTKLLVKDGHTAILGGLTDTQREDTRSGVPILSAIPIVGGLFGRQVRRSVETELFVFLSPRVIRTDEDLDGAAEATGDRTRRLRGRLPMPAGDRTPTGPSK